MSNQEVGTENQPVAPVQEEVAPGEIDTTNRQAKRSEAVDEVLIQQNPGTDRNKNAGEQPRYYMLNRKTGETREVEFKEVAAPQPEVGEAKVVNRTRNQNGA